MSRYSFLIFALLFVSVTSSRRFQPSDFIQLALAASKAAYIPYEHGQFIHNGYIQEQQGRRYEKACNVGDWGAKAYGKRDTEVYLFTHAGQKLAVFGFRGTEPTNLNDWRKNFDIVLANVRINRYRFKLHKGFRDRYADIASWFEAEYRHIPRDYTIILTGHSLGGALATISAAFASDRIHPPDAVITFASPRVGNKDFRKYYRDFVGCHYTLRITEKYDIIPSTPALLLGYSDVCVAQEISRGRTPLSALNPVKNHGLYSGYEKGLQRKYGKYMRQVNLGCDREKSFQ